jgi:hypothetical protein
VSSGFDDWIYWHFFTILTGYNQCLSTIRSSPCWNTRIFSSAVTNDECRIRAHALNCLEGPSSHDWRSKKSKSKSQLLYDWQFTANQFLASGPLRITTRDFFQVNSCGNCSYVTSSLTRRWVCLLWIPLAFRQVYISHIYYVIENSQRVSTDPYIG